MNSVFGMDSGLTPLFCLKVSLCHLLFSRIDDMSISKITGTTLSAIEIMFSLRFLCVVLYITLVVWNIMFYNTSSLFEENWVFPVPKFVMKLQIRRHILLPCQRTTIQFKSFITKVKS